MAKPFHSTMIDHRDEELMVPLTGGTQTPRKAHFLKPTVSSITGPRFELPTLSPKPQWPMKVTYNGWFPPLKNWTVWLYNMHSKYSSRWKQAGIYQSVMLSVYRFARNDELVLGIAERWCADTNTFVFPWGEATITLEDLLVLGGFSVSGDSAFVPLESEKQRRIMEVFERSENIGHRQWLDQFMGSEVEHEAFICLWLSRSVFPGELRCRVSRRVFSSAIHLASGKRLALAPAVLAGLYRDLGLLKQAMLVAGEFSGDYWLFMSLFSPFCFVQVWVWERFLSLRRQPRLIGLGDARMARWRAGKKGKLHDQVENVRGAINVEAFLWRPYAEAVDNWAFPEFYVEKDMWISCGDGLSVELENFARCLRPSHIVGVDCVEPYNPHRVAMQFGFDQDLPGWIGREHMSPEMAWCDFSKPFGADEILYIPRRDYGSCVSSRYLEWWRKTVACLVIPFPGLVKGQRSCRRRRVQFASADSNVPMDFVLKSSRKRKDIYPEVPPGFEHVCSSSHSSSVALNACSEMLEKEKSSTGHNHVLLATSPLSLSSETQPLDHDVSAVRSSAVASKCAETAKELGLMKNSRTDVTAGILSKFTVKKKIGNNIFGNPLRVRNKIGRRARNVSREHKTKLLADVGLAGNMQTVTNQTVRSTSDAEQVKGQLIKSITGGAYRQVLLSKRAMGKENGSSNVNAAVSDIESQVLRAEGEIAALRRSQESSRTSSVTDIERRVSAIKVRVAAIEKELVAMKSNEQRYRSS